MALDRAGNLFIADTFNNRIRKVDMNGLISTVAGNGIGGFSGDGGPALSASLFEPVGVAVDATGVLYIADSRNNRIRSVAADGIIRTIAGGGTRGLADGLLATDITSIPNPQRLAFDNAGNLYSVLLDANRAIKVSPAGILNIVAGTGSNGFGGDGGPAVNALFSLVRGIAVDSQGNLYISDSNNNRIRKILATPPTLSVSNSAGHDFRYHTGFRGTDQRDGNQFGAGTALLSDRYYRHRWELAFCGRFTGHRPWSADHSCRPQQSSAGHVSGHVTITNPNASPTSVSIAVTFQVAPTPKTGLLLQTQSLSFSFTAGNGPSSQQFSVSNQGSGVISFTALAATTTGGAWLSVSPLNGSVSATAPAYVTVTATPGKLSAGTYSGSITFSSPDTRESITVPVTMSISAAQQKILLSQTGLNFTAVAQRDRRCRRISGFSTQGQGSLNWTASASTLSGGSWLSIDVNSGTVARPLLDVSLVNVNIDPTGLAAGDYYGKIQVKAVGAANSPQSISVKLNRASAGQQSGTRTCGPPE